MEEVLLVRSKGKPEHVAITFARQSACSLEQAEAMPSMYLAVWPHRLAHSGWLSQFRRSYSRPMATSEVPIQM